MPTTGFKYHVFLSHSSADKPAVEELAVRLRREGIEPWLDKWNLIPGQDVGSRPWSRRWPTAPTCAVFIGPGGLGTWQNEEMRAAIDRRVGESRDSSGSSRCCCRGRSGPSGASCPRS